MRLAIVSNSAPHHKYFISELYNSFQVELIIQPTGNNIGVFKRLQEKKFFMYGMSWFFMKIASLVYNKLIGTSMMRSLSRSEKLFFKDADKQFNAIPKDKIYSFATVNCADAVSLVKEKEIDIICFLGGDIARKEFIGAAKVCSLNYHSGISPFYNGNKTTFHAVKDYRPNFAGGTLMYITERIDGGGILSHYLPKIELNDTAATLFLKGIYGAVKLYTGFLSYIDNNELPKGVVQQRSFKYVRNIDWTIADDIKLRTFEKERRMRLYQRSEEIIEYFDIIDDDISEVYKRSLNRILRKGK